MTDTARGASWSARERKSGWGRRTAIAVGGIVLLLAVVAGVAIVSINASIDRVGVGGLGEQPSEGTGGAAGDESGGGEDADGDGVADDGAAVDARALTLLVLGSDTREVLTPEEQQELGTGYAEGERTEVISLVRLDPDDDEVRMLSIPRDALVERCNGTRGRINAAYTIGDHNGQGGATCVVETLRDWLGVRIDHAVKVDFRGFVDIVDALGGVSMYLEQPLRDEDAHLDLDAGCVQLDGAESLGFVRARHIDNDFGRMGRQQRFITELRDEVASMGVFNDPARTFRVAQAIAESVELDRSLTLNRIQQLVRAHRSTIQGDIHGQVIPGEIQVLNGAAYVVVDEERADEQVRWLITGDDPADARDAEMQAGGSEEGGATPSDGSDTASPSQVGDPDAPAAPDDADGRGIADRAGSEVSERSDTCR